MSAGALSIRRVRVIHDEDEAPCSRRNPGPIQRRREILTVARIDRRDRTACGEGGRGERKGHGSLLRSGLSGSRGADQVDLHQRFASHDLEGPRQQLLARTIPGARLRPRDDSNLGLLLALRAERTPGDQLESRLAAMRRDRIGHTIPQGDRRAPAVPLGDDRLADPHVCRTGTG
jgi:hypothetical protein